MGNCCNCSFHYSAENYKKEAPNRLPSLYRRISSAAMVLPNRISAAKSIILFGTFFNNKNHFGFRGDGQLKTVAGRYNVNFL